MELSSSPLSISATIFSSNLPPLMMSDTMIGFEVAPLAPIARFFLTSSGSIESSHTLVPVAMSDLSDMRNRPFQSNQPIQRIPTFKYSHQLPATLANLSINYRDSRP